MEKNYNLTEVVVLRATHNGVDEEAAFILNSASKRDEFISRVLNIYNTNPSCVFFQYNSETRKPDVSITHYSDNRKKIVLITKIKGMSCFRLEISCMTGWDGAEAEDNLILLHPIKLTMDKLMSGTENEQD